MQVIIELKNRGGQNIIIACVDGLKRFPEAIEPVFPETEVQLCTVHLVRHSLFYVSHKDRKEVASDLKLIYHAVTLEPAQFYFKTDCLKAVSTIARLHRIFKALPVRSIFV